jgi:hypothetical protein
MHANACVQMVNETLKQASQMRACLFACLLADLIGLDAFNHPAIHALLIPDLSNKSFIQAISLCSIHEFALRRECMSASVHNILGIWSEHLFVSNCWAKCR